MSPYETELRSDWAKREERLASETGWLTLVALTWLEEGASTMGSAEGAIVHLPGWSSPAELGVLQRDGNSVTLTPADGVELKIDDAPITGPTALLADASEEGPTVVSHGYLTFYVIERQGKIGIRAKNSAHPARGHFDGIPRFDPDETYLVDAVLEPFDEPRQIEYPTAIGTTDTATVPGVLKFAHGGQSFELLPFQDAPEDGLFIVFADKTSGVTTYGGGRFLGADAPVDGKVTLDFNRATNPPCAFTPFATCPLPPTENRLAGLIEAGEKTPAGH